jgi:hypothetical protein
MSQQPHLPESRSTGRPAERRPWVSPAVTELPKLTELTLDSGDPIGGGGDPGSGSTVF